MCIEKLLAALKPYLNGNGNSDCPDELHACRMQVRDLQLDYDTQGEQLIRTMGELDQKVNQFNSCLAEGIQSKARIRYLEGELEKLADLLEFDSQPVGDRIIRALQGETADVNTWLLVDRIINDIFKASVQLFNVDMDAYRNRFNSVIFPALLENRGNFQFEDNTRMRTCSIEDLRSAMNRSITRKIPYVNDLWDCENRADKFKSDAAYIYGITSIRRVGSKTSRINHAFNYFYDKNGDDWVFDIGVNMIWNMMDAGKPEIYDVNNWYGFR